MVLAAAPVAVCHLATALVVAMPCCTTVPHVPAAFGAPINESEYTGALSVAHPLDGCTAGSFDPEGTRGHIVLIERGGCNFTQKVYLAQLAGARAALVMPDEAEAHAAAAPPSAFDSRWDLMEVGSAAFVDENAWQLVMSGLGQDTALIRIPSAYISRATGLDLRAERNPTLVLNATGAVPTDGSGIAAPPAALAVFYIVSTLLALFGVSSTSCLVLTMLSTAYAKSGRVRATRRLRTRVVTGKASGPCCICLDDLQGPLKALPCEHEFHDACITPWLEAKSTLCPLCKRDALPPELGECEPSSLSPFAFRVPCRSVRSFVCCVCGPTGAELNLPAFLLFAGPINRTHFLLKAAIFGAGCCVAFHVAL
jgi:hypothetical protein